MRKVRYIYLTIILLSSSLWAVSQDIENVEKEVTEKTGSNITEDFQWGFNIVKNKRENTAAISMIQAKDLHSSSTNAGNALYGKLSGLGVMQGDNVIWSNDPKMFIRGIATLNNSNPLILIDGFERPIASVSSESIESIEVIKDAAALSLYGMRGANGVVSIRTKRGISDDLTVKVSYQFGLNKPFRLPKFADGPTYAAAYNEARYLDGLSPMYNDFDMNDFALGNNSELLPNVDWVGEALRNTGYNNQLTASFSGGSQWIRYYSSVEYVGDQGFVNPSNFNSDYKSQMSWNRLGARANLDIDVTSSTLLQLNVLGQIYQHHRPSVNYSSLFSTLYNVPSAAFPIKTTTGHWGGDYIHNNPIAEIVDKGYTDGNDRALYADMRLTQDLSSILTGLSAEVALGYDNQASYWEGESRTYQMENIQYLRDQNGVVGDINRNIHGIATSLQYSSQLGYQNKVINFDGKVNYKTKWGEKHSLRSSLIYHMEENSLMGRNTTYRRQSIIGNALYGLKDRYFFDATVTYAGSSVMSKGDKFRVYPAFSAAWILSSEDFLSSSSIVNFLKLRASWGMSGNDQFAYELDKQFFTLGGTAYYFGANNSTASGATEGRLANSKLNSETANKFNFGFDLNMWKHLTLTADVFYEKRTNILVSSSNVYSSALGVLTPMMNEGEVKNKGLDISLGWTKQVGNWGYKISGNLMFARNEIVNMNEGYMPHSYLKQTGQRVGQYFGLKTIGFFKDETDIANSPEQSFSQVRPGDLKYKDQNGDNVIDDYDKVALGYSTLAPEIYYGVDFGFNYKGFSFSANFQGVANYSVVKNMASMYWPFRNNTTVSDHYLENRWTPENTNAKYPRLTTLNNSNNFRDNSIWVESGAYLKLRNVEVNYSLPNGVNKLIRATNINLFARGMNLFSIDNIKTLDPEQMVASYPSYKSYHFGVNLEF